MIQTAQQAYPAPRDLSYDTPVLVTERLVLRPPHADDAVDLAAIANNRQIAEMTSRMPFPYNLSDAHSFLEGCLAGEHEGYIYAITLADTGHLIGLPDSNCANAAEASNWASGWANPIGARDTQRKPQARSSTRHSGRPTPNASMRSVGRSMRARATSSQSAGSPSSGLTRSTRLRPGGFQWSVIRSTGRHGLPGRNADGAAQSPK